MKHWLYWLLACIVVSILQGIVDAFTDFKKPSGIAFITYDLGAFILGLLAAYTILK